MPEPILQMQGLEAHYGDFQALYGIDMERLRGLQKNELIDHMAKQERRLSE